MIELNSKIKNALIKIDFVKKYGELSGMYTAEKTPSDKRLVNIDGEEVMEMLQKLGYSSTFVPKEKFYKTGQEQVGPYTLCVHYILECGMVDVVWVVKEGDELLLGAPLGTYSKRILENGYRIKKPVFGDYDQLEEILEIILKMYEEFKNALLVEFAMDYNWDDGFDIPRKIIEENCELGIALMMFYLADGTRYLENKEEAKKSSLKGWLAFIEELYTRIINGEYKVGNISFESPLTKVQKYKLQKVLNEKEQIFINTINTYDERK